MGPHIDQYDVFIIQGSGKRRWRVGARDEGQYQDSLQGALRQIDAFDAIIDQVLEAGDILYIPPGFPHEGMTLEPSMSYSMGFRSPKEQELLSHFADFVLSKEQGDVHLHNPNMQAQVNHGEIAQTDLTLLTKMLKSAISSQQNIEEFLATSLSLSRHQLDIMVPQKRYSNEEIYTHLAAMGNIIKTPGLRALYHVNDTQHIYVNGEQFEITDTHFAQLLCNQQQINVDSYPIESTCWINLVTELVNLGYWYLDEL